MTLLEKYIADHPDDSAVKNGAKLPQFCPWAYNYGSAYCGCLGAEDEDGACVRCWDREITEENPIKSVVEGKISMNEAREKIGMPPLGEPRILDSGDRTEFSTGAVRDMREGKGRCDLLPLDVVGRYIDDKIIEEIGLFQETGSVYRLYRCLDGFAEHWDDGKIKADVKAIVCQRRCTMLLEVAKHFEEGATKYGDNNWRKGIPVRYYIDSAVRHYLKFLRGDKDEPHDRAFCWNIMCAIWTCKHMPELNEYGKDDSDASDQ